MQLQLHPHGQAILQDPGCQISTVKRAPARGKQHFDRRCIQVVFVALELSPSIILTIANDEFDLIPSAAVSKIAPKIARRLTGSRCFQIKDFADSRIHTGYIQGPAGLQRHRVPRVAEQLQKLETARLGQRLREALSPRHVPNVIRAVPDVPRTLSGKKLEVPIRKILAGVPEEKALKRGTLANPECLAPLLAASRGAT